MIHLLDGPAADVALACIHAPQLLRVVCTTRGEWDALDQPEDAPHRHEMIHVYHRVRLGSPMFIDWRDRAGRRRGSRCADADYQFLPRQPAESIVRDNEAWREWRQTAITVAQYPRLAVDHPKPLARQSQLLLFDPSPASLPDVGADRR